MPGLLGATVLVELHPLIDPQIPEVVTGRFASTHTIKRVRGKPRNPADWAEVAGLDRQDAALLLSESRIVQEAPGASALFSEWALMTPRPSGIQ